MKYIISIQSLVPGDGWHDIAAFRWRTDAVSYAKSISRDAARTIVSDLSVRLEGQGISYYYRDGAEFVRPAMSLDDLIQETGLCR